MPAVAALAGLALVNLTVPGHPMIFSNWPFVSDLRTGSFSGGSGEEAVLNAASAQLTNFYDLPSGVAAGMTDSKLPDMQSGCEHGVNAALTAILELTANPNIILPGMLALITAGLVSRELFGVDSVYLVMMRARGLDYRHNPLTQTLHRIGVASVMERRIETLQDHITRHQLLGRQADKLAVAFHHGQL